MTQVIESGNSVQCSVCEQGFDDEENIIGITGAKDSDKDEAIIPDDQPWLFLLHSRCWRFARDAIQAMAGNTVDEIENE